MNDAITCPRCHFEFEITEVMRAQITSEVRTEFESEAAARQAELNAAKRELEKERLDIKAARLAIEGEVRAQVASQRDAILKEARKSAENELTAELRDRDDQLTTLKKKLKTAQDSELELRKRERQLQERTEELQLEVARQLDSERDKLRANIREQLEQQHLLKDTEKEKQISDMRRQIDDLKRKAEQGSQQLQGEAQEIVLNDLLSDAFPADTIERVGKGIVGGDALQTVLDLGGAACGTILWESKRTKNWSNGWLPKLRDDQRSARSACAVIVTEVLPDGIRTFGLVDGVWVCSWPCAIGLATALRTGLLEVAKGRLALQGQNEKMEMVYNYLSSPEFRHRVAGIVEAFVTLQQDLEAEKRSMQRVWSKREKQVQRALTNTAALYGDLQGIIGASLPVIDALSLSAIETGEAKLAECAVGEIN